MKCVYHLPRDVVLPNVISVGERAPPKVGASGDFVVGEGGAGGAGGGQVAVPENCQRSKQPDWKQKALCLSKNCQYMELPGRLKNCKIQ